MLLVRASKVILHLLLHCLHHWLVLWSQWMIRATLSCEIHWLMLNTLQEVGYVRWAMQAIGLIADLIRPHFQTTFQNFCRRFCKLGLGILHGTTLGCSYLQILKLGVCYRLGRILIALPSLLSLEIIFRWHAVYWILSRLSDLVLTSSEPLLSTLSNEFIAFTQEHITLYLLNFLFHFLGSLLYQAGRIVCFLIWYFSLFVRRVIHEPAYTFWHFQTLLKYLGLG